MTTRREQIAANEAELHMLWRRAHRLQLYVAQYGISAEPGRVMELEDVEAQIAQLQQTLTQLRNVMPDAQAPYIGLKTFDEAHARFFYGREALIDTLVERVKHTSFLSVIGASGSGKSSVVRAGLIPALKQGLDLAGSNQWVYVSPFPPGPRPMNALAAALAGLPNSTRVGSAIAIEERLKRPDGLLFCVDQLLEGKPNARFVLVIDQAEELWTLAPSDRAAQETHRRDQQQPFIAQLLHATQTVDRRVLVVLTLRADFMGRVANEPALADVVKQQLEIVSPMEPPDLRCAIEIPAEIAGGTFQPGLVDELIDQVVGEEGALPLLEYTLESLWGKKQPDGTLTWEAYRAIGGVEGALAEGADRVLVEHYAEPEQRDAIREVLLRLVQPGDRAVDSRRRVPLRDLVPAGRRVDTVQELITPLVDARLLTTGRETDTQQETVEVTHEALIRSWPTLRDWIAAAKGDLRLQRQLEDAAREWEAEKGSRDLLWQGVRLAHAEAWVAQAHPMLLEREQQFLVASRSSETTRVQAERRRALSIITGLVVALVLITGFAGGTVWFWQSAKRTGQVSQARFLIAEGQRQYDERPLLGLRLMAEGLANVPTNEMGVRRDLVAAVMTNVRQGRVQLITRDATSIVGESSTAQMLIVARRNQPGILIWGDRLQETSLPHPVAIDSNGKPAVAFSPHGDLGVLNYAEGAGGALVRANGTVVPLPHPLDTNGSDGGLFVVFSPQGNLIIVNYAKGAGGALVHADGTIVPLPHSLVINSLHHPAVVFSPRGDLVAVSYTPPRDLNGVTYIENIGGVLLRADGTIVPLPHPLDISDRGQPVVIFSPHGDLVAVNYAEGVGGMLMRADGTIVPLPHPLDMKDDQPAIFFSPQGELGVIHYADGAGEALLRADRTVVPLLHPLVDNAFSPAFIFSPRGNLVAVNYAEGVGGRLVRADGSVVPLPHPLAIDSMGQPAVVFSPQGQLVAVGYAEGMGGALVRANGTIVSLSHPLAIDRTGRPIIVFSPEGQLIAIGNREGGSGMLMRTDGTFVSLPHPLAVIGGEPAITFRPHGDLAAVNYAEDAGGALVRADGSVVSLPYPFSTTQDKPAVVFSSQGKLGVINYTEGAGGVLVRTNGTFVSLPYPIAKNMSGQPAVVFSPQGDVAAVNYVEGAGGALVRADGTVVSLSHPLATTSITDMFSYEHPSVDFSSENRLVDLTYVTGHHELRILDDVSQIIDLGSNVTSVVFMTSGLQIIVSYRDGYVYIIDPHLPSGATALSSDLSADDLIAFICNNPLKSGFWTSQDDADLAKTLQGATPQACR